MKGYIHSFETCGTVDGPGLRFVVFLQACPLRCKYCHNPDTWKIEDAKYERTTDYILNEIKKYKEFFQNGGGITLSGGEPLVQIEFVLELLEKVKKEGIHTALDTSGYIFNEKVKEVLKYVDLVLLDIKCIDFKEYKNLTGVELDNTLKFAEYLNQINKKTWIRHVLVPEITDNDEYLNKLAEYISKFKNIEFVEILPFHQMATFKWEEMGLKYELEKTKEPTNERLENAKKIFKSYGLKVR